MKTRLTLRPGQNGTKKLLGKYGGRLLAVRYRYDPEHRRRLKTVELIEEELPWDPAFEAKPRHKADDLVRVRIAFSELDLRQRAKDAGANWDKERKLWTLTYGAAVALGLEARIVE